MQRIHRGFLDQPTWIQILSLLLLTLVVTALDISTGPELSVSIFYLLPILLGTRARGRRCGFVLSILSAALWLAVDRYNQTAAITPLASWNALVRFGFFSISMTLFAKLNEANRDLEGKLEVESKRLLEEMRQRQAMEHELLEASFRAQREMAHHLHDGVAQSLAGIALKTRDLSQRLGGLQAGFGNETSRLADQLGDSLAEVRRLCKGLEPIELDAGGLVTAVARLVEQASEFSGVACRFHANTDLVKLAPPADIYVFRIMQEAITNALKHSGASQVDVDMIVSGGQLTLAVHDNGRGFDPSLPHSGMGQRIMKHRAASIGADLHITSSSNGTEARLVMMLTGALAPKP